MYINQSKNHVYLKTVLKEKKKTVLLLIPNNILNEEELSKITETVVNFRDNKILKKNITFLIKMKTELQ